MLPGLLIAGKRGYTHGFFPQELSMNFDPAAVPPLDADELMHMADRIEGLPPDVQTWVSQLFHECLRARMHEAEMIAEHGGNSNSRGELEQQLAQIALDTAEWLKTLWTVGYMGAGHLPAQPRSAFPTVELEDVIKSSLFSRIRQGKKPLPFPPPTRHGSPWHEIVEGTGITEYVDAEVIRDETGAPIGLCIEGCTGWRIVEELNKDQDYLVQHQGKGPVYRLHLDPFASRLQQEPPRWRRRIHLRERGGFRNYTLEWPRDEDPANPQRIALRAATWERAESEAAHWVANNFPEMYGQIQFERCEPIPAGPQEFDFSLPVSWDKF